MISGVFMERGNPPSVPSLFRGRSLEFWIAHVFPGIPFFPRNDIPADTRSVLTCNPDKFPISHACPTEVVTWLRSLSARGESFSLQDDALRLMPIEQWREAPDSPLEPLTPPFFMEFPDAEADPLRTEAWVVSLQVLWLKKRGVQIEDLAHFYMEGLIPVGAESVISTGVVICGDSIVGNGVRIKPHCVIENSRIGDGCTLLPGCVIRDSRIGKGGQMGPYCHLRQEVQVGDSARVGNFVEMKKSDMGNGSKASHLSYLGDAKIGQDVNIGAGTITCNYDGVNKHQTVIEDGVFVGSGSELVAPVHLHRNSFVAAGSTVTEDVPEGALALARQRQRNLLGWRNKKRRNTCKS